MGNRELRRPLFLLMVSAVVFAACNKSTSEPDTSDGSRIIAEFTQGSAYFYYNPPTLVGHFIYIGTSRKLAEDPAPDNYFFKLDEDLNKVWAYPLGSDEVRGGAALDDAGNIYFVVEKGRVGGDSPEVRDFLYRLNTSGEKQWEFEITSTAGGWTANLGMHNPAIGVDGTIYVGGGKLYALNSGGSVLWEYPPAGSMPGMNVKNGPILDESGNIYFVNMGNVYSLDAATGTMNWVFATDYPNGGLSTLAFSVDYGSVYAAIGQTIHCLDAATGSENWQLTPPGIGGEFRGTPAVDDHDNVYVGTKDNQSSILYAVGSDGRLLWQNPVGADLYSSPALGDDRTIYIGSEYTEPYVRFHAIDMATGTIRWSVSFPGYGDVTWSSPVLSDAGVVYIGTMNGTLYAIRSDATGLLPNAGSPRFHLGNANTGRRE